MIIQRNNYTSPKKLNDKFIFQDRMYTSASHVFISDKHNHLYKLQFSKQFTIKSKFRSNFHLIHKLTKIIKLAPAYLFRVCCLIYLQFVGYRSVGTYLNEVITINKDPKVSSEVHPRIALDPYKKPPRAHTLRKSVIIIYQTRVVNVKYTSGAISRLKQIVLLFPMKHLFLA